MLSRLALRLAAVELLTGATVAGRYVYDSREDAIDGLEDNEARPVISVYTEDDRAKPYRDGKTGPAEFHVYLVIEAMVVVKGEMAITAGDGTTEVVNSIGVPMTDTEHEALVDTLDAQIRRRVRGVDLDAASILFRKVAAGIEEIESMPQRDADRATRLAGRTIRVKVKVPDDKWPDVAGAMPEPLGTIASGLTLPSLVATASAVLGRLAPPSARVPLSEIRIHAGIDQRPPDEASSPVNGSVTLP